jgi:hypothetical protein
MAERQILRFEYDPEELGHLGPCLTPVYFNKQLLTRYVYDAGFKCEFASATYGTIYADKWLISFGINKQGAVIAWLGDISRLPLRERFYWLVENIPSQHDYASEFYDGQIEIQYTPPPPAVQTLNAITSFNAKVELKFGFPLYFRRSVEGRIEDVARYSRLILANRDDFVRFVTELSGIITEAVNSNDIRAHLTTKTITLDPKDKETSFSKLSIGPVLVTRTTSSLPSSTSMTFASGLHMRRAISLCSTSPRRSE